MVFKVFNLWWLYIDILLILLFFGAAAVIFSISPLVLKTSFKILICTGIGYCFITTLIFNHNNF